MASTTTTVVGGTAGWIGGATAGAAVGSAVPTIGTVIGGILGSFAAGAASNKVTNTVLGTFIEDDADELVRSVEKEISKRKKISMPSEKEMQRSLKEVLVEIADELEVVK